MHMRIDVSNVVWHVTRLDMHMLPQFILALAHLYSLYFSMHTIRLSIHIPSIHLDRLEFLHRQFQLLIVHLGACHIVTS